MIKSAAIGVIVGITLFFMLGNIRTITYAWKTSDGKYVDIQSENYFRYLDRRGYERKTMRVSDWKEVSLFDVLGSTWNAASGKGGFLYKPEQIEWIQIKP